MTSRPMTLVEVGPRDGLQNDPTLLDVPTKLELIERLVACGARRIEAVSFVNPARVPQMAGAEEIMAARPGAGAAALIGLALNAKGVERALAAGCDEINFVVCATDSFGVRNQGATPADSLKVLGETAPLVLAKAVPLSVTISVAFGCPFEGEVDAGAVAAIAAEAAACGADEIALGDTIGVADPWTVRDLTMRLRQAAPSARLRMHFHNTRNTALANAFAAIESGVDVLDSSVGGIGGCPFAPKATGNVATEDLVYMLERAGFSTGLDLDRLIATAHWLEGALRHGVPSMLAKAGPFPTPRTV